VNSQQHIATQDTQSQHSTTDTFQEITEASCNMEDVFMQSKIEKKHAG